MTEQDKQALIEYYCQRDCGHTREECCLDNCHEIMLIEEFPTTPTDTDTISREQAIDALTSIVKDASLRNRNVYSTAKKCMRAIEDLPSVQPETAKRIVESKDGVTHWYQCDMCDAPVDVQDNFCRGCGRRLTNG